MHIGSAAAVILRTSGTRAAGESHKDPSASGATCTTVPTKINLEHYRYTRKLNSRLCQIGKALFFGIIKYNHNEGTKGTGVLICPQYLNHSQCESNLVNMGRLSN